MEWHKGGAEGNVESRARRAAAEDNVEAGFRSSLARLRHKM